MIFFFSFFHILNVFFFCCYCFLSFEMILIKNKSIVFGKNYYPNRFNKNYNGNDNIKKSKLLSELTKQQSDFESETFRDNFWIISANHKIWRNFFENSIRNPKFLERKKTAKIISGCYSFIFIIFFINAQDSLIPRKKGGCTRWTIT